MRSSTALFTAFSVIIGVVLFRVKYEVDHLAYEHKSLAKNIRNTEESIHVLKAEWAHLNDPARIHKLAVKYLPSQSAPNTVQTVYKDTTTLPEKDVIKVSRQEEPDVFSSLLSEEEITQNQQSIQNARYQKGGS